MYVCMWAYNGNQHLSPQVMVGMVNYVMYVPSLQSVHLLLCEVMCRAHHSHMHPSHTNEKTESLELYVAHARSQSSMSEG